jgi:hypothetical protein
VRQHPSVCKTPCWTGTGSTRPPSAPSTQLPIRSPPPVRTPLSLATHTTSIVLLCRLEARFRHKGCHHRKLGQARLCEEVARRKTRSLRPLGQKEPPNGYSRNSFPQETDPPCGDGSGRGCPGGAGRPALSVSGRLADRGLRVAEDRGAGGANIAAGLEAARRRGAPGPSRNGRAPRAVG